MPPRLRVKEAIKYYETAVQEYQDQACALKAQGRNADWNAVRTNLNHFSQQIDKDLRTHLGDDRFNRINRNQIILFGQ